MTSSDQATITAPTVSGYLTLPLRTEAEARAERADAFEAELAAIGERAFFSVARMRTDTEQLLFEARSVVQSLSQRELLSQAGFDELLLAECKHLCGGDTLKAQLLASAAIG